VEITNSHIAYFTKDGTKTFEADPTSFFAPGRGHPARKLNYINSYLLNDGPEKPVLIG
jgi:hypothetical protein